MQILMTWIPLMVFQNCNRFVLHRAENAPGVDQPATHTIHQFQAYDSPAVHHLSHQNYRPTFHRHYIVLGLMPITFGRRTSIRLITAARRHRSQLTIMYPPMALQLTRPMRDATSAQRWLTRMQQPFSAFLLKAHYISHQGQSAVSANIVSSCNDKCLLGLLAARIRHWRSLSRKALVLMRRVLPVAVRVSFGYVLEWGPYLDKWSLKIKHGCSNLEVMYVWESVMTQLFCIICIEKRKDK